MAYSAEISRGNPTCFVFLIDQSGSMADVFGGGDPTGAASAIRSLKSNDGEVLLFNIHLSPQRGAQIEYPSNSETLPDKFAQQLFQMSSQLPESMLNLAKKESVNAAEGSRGFVFNADMVAVIKFLDIGTRPSALR